MSKFVIECPHCGTYQEVSTGFFARKIIECKCGKIIDVNKDRFTLKECPHCGNSVLYDQKKGDKAICPICKEKLITEASKSNFVFINCPSCACKLQVSKNAKTYQCPLCKENIDVQKQIIKDEIMGNGIASVIKYEGPNNVLVWKHPIEDFNLGSQLIVHESQEAIFFRDGQALDCFGAGRYTLATQKLPLLNNIYKLPFDGNSAFHSEVYFINLVTQTNIKWGTDSKVRMFDPQSGLHLELGAAGEFNIRVFNSRKLLIKLVGTTSELKNTDIIYQNPFDVKVLTGKFKALIVSKVKTMLARTIKDNNINVLEIDEHLEELSDKLKEEINKTLEEYGLTMPEFYVLSVATPDDDPNFKRLKEQYAEQYLLVKEEQIKENIALAQQQREIVEAQTNAQKELIAAQAKAEAYKLKAAAEASEMQLKGYTYQDETKRNVSMAAMENLGKEGTQANNTMSSLLKDSIGLGVAFGTVGEVAKMTKEVIQPTVNMTKNVFSEVSSNGWKCPNCNKEGITSNFCPDCGTKKPTDDTSWNCMCGTKGITSAFCPNCGKKRGE